MPKSSGATNRGRARAAAAERNTEADAESLRLSHLLPEEAAQLAQIFTWLDLVDWHPSVGGGGQDDEAEEDAGGGPPDDRPPA